MTAVVRGGILPPKINDIVFGSNNNVWCKKQKLALARVIRSAASICLESDECGVRCSEIGDSCVVSMTLDNGSAAKLLLPSGLVTSFKVEMWHGATMELLHTSVSSDNSGGAPLIQGGLSLALALGHNDDDVARWSPNGWALNRVTGTPQDSIQVELISTSEQAGNAQVKHVITLGRDYLSSEVVVSNPTASSSLHLTGSALCHLAVSTPDATYALGLQGSDFLIRPPFASDFSIIPSDFMATTTRKSSWPFNKLFARNAIVDDVVRGTREEETEYEEEDDDYKHLTEKLCRIYANAPRDLTIMDRGRRNSVAVRRNGFKEVYMMSPGSQHEWYSKYSYICIGHAALREPVILNARSEWRGGLELWNPNS